MIILFYPLKESQKSSPDIVAIRVRINYFETLASVLEKFNQQQYNKLGFRVTKLYNKYGQEIPLTYHVQKNNLDVYWSEEN